MVLQLYLDPFTINSRKVLAGLDLMGRKYDLHHVDYLAGAHKGAEYTKINPMATIPAAKDGDCVITESNAIMQYAADLDGGSPYYPKDLKQRAAVNKWLLWEASAWFPSCYVYIVQNVVQPLFGAKPDQAAIDKEAPQWNKLAGVLETQLSETKWVAGNDVTIADIAIASCIHVRKAMKMPLDKYPSVERWMSQVDQIPAWKNTQGAVDKMFFPGRTPVNGSNGTNEVRATFNYTKDVEGLTEIYFYETEAAKNVHEPGDDPHEIAVHDGWHRAKEFSYDTEGFSLHDLKTGYSEWEDDEGVRAKFYPEVVDFLQKTTGASRVLVFDHTIRTKGNDQKKITDEKNTSQRAPVMLVHCDYTAESGPLRVRQLLPDEADDLLSRRVAFLNVWKPIRNVVEERPLAMCDITSSPPEDFFKLHLRYRDRDGENYVMRHSPAHKWWYFPKMTPDQVIILKTFDSETDGRARFVGHSAFEDPTTRADAPVRESVEIRTIAFF